MQRLLGEQNGAVEKGDGLLNLALLLHIQSLVEERGSEYHNRQIFLPFQQPIILAISLRIIAHLEEGNPLTQLRLIQKHVLLQHQIVELLSILKLSQIMIHQRLIIICLQQHRIHSKHLFISLQCLHSFPEKRVYIGSIENSKL
jgi:hypothetical protein